MMKKLVAITGASSGIGKALSERFSAMGHPVLMMARRVEKMEALHLEHAMCKAVDVTDYEAWKQEIHGGLEPEQVAYCVQFAYQMPQSVSIREIVVTKTLQKD